MVKQKAVFNVQLTAKVQKWSLIPCRTAGVLCDGVPHQKGGWVRCCSHRQQSLQLGPGRPSIFGWISPVQLLHGWPSETPIHGPTSLWSLCRSPRWNFGGERDFGSILVCHQPRLRSWHKGVDHQTQRPVEQEQLEAMPWGRRWCTARSACQAFEGWHHETEWPRRPDGRQDPYVRWT